MENLPNRIKNCQSRLKFLLNTKFTLLKFSKTINILPNWWNFAKSGRSDRRWVIAKGKRRRRKVVGKSEGLKVTLIVVVVVALSRNLADLLFKNESRYSFLLSLSLVSLKVKVKFKPISFTRNLLFSGVVVVERV